ncbi:MAG: hypothetical protein F7B17_01310 [Desulfurococcales archaeon]|nr:hypothetical protein [Desulfurococcales archaeon]
MASTRAFRRAILLTGTTGIGFGRVLDIARKLVGPECVDKFEDYLVLGPCGDVEQYIRYLNISGGEAKTRFREALSRMVEKLRQNNCSDVVIAIHLTYLTGYSITPNPVIPEVLRIADDVRVIHVADDWYDVIVRIARSTVAREKDCERRELGFTIDPETVVNWRSADFSLTSLSEEMGASRWYLIAVKHTPSTFERLLEEVLGRRSYLKAYISHPIRGVRRLYVELKCLVASEMGWNALSKPPLRTFSKFPLVTVIEGFKSYVKNLLEKTYGGAILFEPTTIDELLIDATRLEGEGCGAAELLVEPSMEARWPYPQDTIAEYDYGESMEKALKGALIALRGFGLSAYMELLSRTGRKSKAMEGFRTALEYALLRFKEAIEEQIEARDYKYIEQSDILIASVPALAYCDNGGKVHLAIMPSRGVSDEVKRAMALSKPIYFYILPLDLKVLLKSLEGYTRLDSNYGDRIAGKLAEAFGAGGDELRACPKPLSLSEPGSLTRNLASGVFSEVPPSARIMIMPSITSVDVLESPATVAGFYSASKPITLPPKY